jgi:predicted nucleotidyltransferase
MNTLPTAAQQHIAHLQAQPDVLGILLFGSWARGNNRPDSDIDLLVIVREGFRRTVEYHNGTAFEITYTTEQGASEYWRSSPDDAVELWRVATVLYDRDGTMARLAQVGQTIHDQGKPPLEPEHYAHVQFDIRDQLRAAEELALSDPMTARLLLSTLVVRLTELYFDLRQLWTPPPKQRLGILRQSDRAISDLVASYYEEGSLTNQLRIAHMLFAAVFM